MLSADLILHNGRIHTMAAPGARAQAVAIAGDRIVAVGSDDVVLETRGSRTELIDLGGCGVIPGLVDCHVHFAWVARGMDRIDLSGVGSLAEAVEIVGRRAESLPPGEWLLGGRWNHNLWELDRFPNRHDVDAAAGDHPLLLSSKDGHVALANSAALRLAGVDASTPDPAGGEIERDERGEPTGILKENAEGLLTRVVPEETPESLLDPLRRAFAIAHSYGLTGVHDREGETELAALQMMAAKGELGLRVFASIPSRNLDNAIALGLCSGLGDEWLRIGGVKIFADGALGGRTADMLAAYEGRPEDCGIEVSTTDELADLVMRAAKAGIHSSVHAIGDRANRRVLDAVEATYKAGAPRLRHRIEHVQLLHPDDLARLAQLGIIASMQPVHATSDYAMADRYWGSRSRYAYAWRSLLDAGTALAFGSDAPVESLNPWYGIYAAVTRQTPEGAPKGGWYPEERLSLEEAIRAFTMGAAFASGEEGTKGSIEAGKYADLVVLSADPFEEGQEVLLESPVEMTILAGEIAYRV